MMSRYSRSLQFCPSGFKISTGRNFKKQRIILQSNWKSKVAVQAMSTSAVRSVDSFKFKDLQVTLAPPEKLKRKPDVGSLVFGKHFTDHMFEVEWELESGWSAPKISPMHDLAIHPASKALHYAIQLFEGMKAYRGVDGKIRLFRPDLNMKRILRGARRAFLPEFEPNEFLKCLDRLITIEEQWVPRSETSSLYIRPTYIGTDPTLSVAPSKNALLFVILCPVGPYFATGFKPVSLLADPAYSRSFPGGSGDTKLGSNYAPTISFQKIAEQQGHQQVLWLYGEDHEITEVGSMNIFIFLKNEKGENELVTPPLQGLILPGVTRQSILDLTREWNEFKVSERSINMEELITLKRENRLLEIFGSGTACIVCPVAKISYMGKNYAIPTVEHPKPVHVRILKNLSDIYYGRVSHPWGVIVSRSK